MALEEYKKKRDFKKTTEPSGEDGEEDRNIFVIQKHDASHLHYDFRMSLDGVLKSWAVPKEPPMTKGTKRLAIMTEDHPLGYATFEGTIPRGEYGAGTVEIWDSGTFELEERGDEKIVFVLYGRKLGGRYVMLKFPKAGVDGWLFFKAD
jgi:DNA ligase D-like protein (predicted 3'-phosphoesterase)